jgi:DNA-binding response OmpR family regulator
MGEGGDIPVIIISIDDSEKSRRRAMEAGAVAFFPKPIDHYALLTAIRARLSGNAAGETPGPA